MIKFRRDGENLKIIVGGIMPGLVHDLPVLLEDTLVAQVLADRFTHTLEKNLSKKIEQAYLEGYNSGKNHEKKKTKFLGTFDTQTW